MPRLVALSEVWYASRKYNAGEEFDSSDIDATILCAHDVPGGARARRAAIGGVASTQPDDAPPPPQPEPPAQPTPATEPEAKAEADLPSLMEAKEAAAEEADASSENKRRYKRRDMRAEE